MIPKETVDEIFQTARVEEVIGEFVQLKKSGSNFKGKSPFVDERTPSFMVSPAKQIWKCFSTGKGGNVVSFLMEAEHFSFVEALKWLANKYNIKIKEDRERTPEEIEAHSIRENLSIINEFAKNTFQDNLTKHPKGKAIGLSYFLERGFREDIIEKFQLGYCLEESDGFTKIALEKNYKLDYLVKAGLTKVKDGRSFDFFRGRVMFPIHSIAGKVLGFGGRTLKTDKKVAKYFNSPESELYNKSQILYGLYYAKNAIIKYDNCYLVEGYTDVISLHQAGVENVVASSGTSLTSGQIKLIKRYSENITILYDGDSAGIRASFRGIDMILAEGMNVKVVLFPDGEDPDSYAKKSTTEELKEYISANSKDFIVFKSDVLLKDAGDDPLKKAQLINDIVGSVAVIDDAIKRQIYSRECATIFDIEEQTIIQEVNRVRQKKKAEQQRTAERNRKQEERNKDRGRQTNQSQSTPNTQSPVADGPPQDYDIPVEAMMPSDLAAEIGIGVKVKDKNDLYPFELDLIRIMLNYGLYQVRAQHIEENDAGDEVIVDVDVSAIELIIHELIKDDISFENGLFNEILTEYKKGLEEGIFYKTDHFIRHSNMELSSACADIMASKHEVSPNWQRQKVRITTEIDKLDQAVMTSIYAYKSARVRKQISEIQTQIDNLNSIGSEESIMEIIQLLSEQKKLDNVKKILAGKLGRTM